MKGSALALAQLMILRSMLGEKETPLQPPQIPIEVLKKEYDLIQVKKSTFSANQRRKVVFEYERRISESCDGHTR